MLTTTSGMINVSGYQAQPGLPHSERFPSRETFPESKKTDDTVDISAKAKEIQTEYQQKDLELDRKHKIESQQLEREYIEEKNRLENEFNLKKQRLEINVFV